MPDGLSLCILRLLDAILSTNQLDSLLIVGLLFLLFFFAPLLATLRLFIHHFCFLVQPYREDCM